MALVSNENCLNGNFLVHQNPMKRLAPKRQLVDNEAEDADDEDFEETEEEESFLTIVDLENIKAIVREVVLESVLEHDVDAKTRVDTSRDAKRILGSQTPTTEGAEPRGEALQSVQRPPNKKTLGPKRPSSIMAPCNLSFQAPEDEVMETSQE